MLFFLPSHLTQLITGTLEWLQARSAKHGCQQQRQPGACGQPSHNAVVFGYTQARELDNGLDEAVLKRSDDVSRVWGGPEQSPSLLVIVNYISFCVHDYRPCVWLYIES
ncbi:hypothetical protein ACRALDRAFT_212742 [Sodiomyces alcalophilus JCM 7366]|uniref:uncharacterized protein n=1 Tax=Sodiomyces alcalophilus JCM 7366 TaxID=591952 RepID=UPI0039B3FF18